MKLSSPSKMPCASVGLPALTACHTGGRLAQVPGSVCASCYATKGNYRFKNAKTPRESNLAELQAALAGTQDDRGAWCIDMADAIIATGLPYFRWHDSGDLQSVDHLMMIVKVCKLTPGVRHWLPTREYAMVQAVMFDLGNGMPSNLTIRLSAHMIGKTLEPAGGICSSSVDAGVGWQCPATHNPRHEGKCLDCRACWNRKVGNVDYSKH